MACPISLPAALCGHVAGSGVSVPSPPSAVLWSCAAGALDSSSALCFGTPVLHQTEFMQRSSSVFLSLDNFGELLWQILGNSLLCRSEQWPLLLPQLGPVWLCRADEGHRAARGRLLLHRLPPLRGHCISY